MPILIRLSILNADPYPDPDPNPSFTQDRKSEILFFTFTLFVTFSSVSEFSFQYFGQYLKISGKSIEMDTGPAKGFRSEWIRIHNTNTV